jgi:hypothetical protein
MLIGDLVESQLRFGLVLHKRNWFSHDFIDKCIGGVVGEARNDSSKEQRGGVRMSEHFAVHQSVDG